MEACNHKPENTMLVRFDSKRGVYIGTMDETCRYCHTKIKMKKPVLAKFLFVLVVLLFVFRRLIIMLLQVKGVLISSAASVITALVLPGLEILFVISGGWLFKWVPDQSNLHRTTVDPSKIGTSRGYQDTWNTRITM